MLITAGKVRSWNCCYDREDGQEGRPFRLDELYKHPVTPQEVLTRKDGLWADVPWKDRLWTIFHEGIIAIPLVQMFAVWAARYLVDSELSRGRQVNQLHLDVMTELEKFLEGQVTQAQLTARRQELSDSLVTNRLFKLKNDDKERDKTELLAADMVEVAANICVEGKEFRRGLYIFVGVNRSAYTELCFGEQERIADEAIQTRQLCDLMDGI